MTTGKREGQKMAHIKRIDLTRDVEAHADAYREAIEKVCRETAFSGGKYAGADYESRVLPEN